MSNERIDRLEERLAWLQRHVTEQDRAMLEMSVVIDRLKAEVARLKARDEAAGHGAQADEARDPAAERPPHY